MSAEPPAELTSELERQPTLEVDHVGVSYTVRGSDRLALRDVSFQIGRRESYGLVGESGSGKSTMALALTRYLPRNGRVSAGKVTIAGQDLLALNKKDLQHFRARTVSMVYQEPGRSLNPSLRVGRQLAEVFEILGLDKSSAYDQSLAAMARVQISDPARVMRSYPHQLSGGMLQRVIIAMALASEPSLLILDEPTTALDATVEAEVLDLVQSLRHELEMSVLLISHNLAVIAKMCDRVGVMYAGELVEEGPALKVFNEPRHPYTVGLIRCIPRRGQRKDQSRLDTIPGFLPAPGETGTGCIFAARCGLAEERCLAQEPPMYALGAERGSRCHFHARATSLPRADIANVQTRSYDGEGASIIRLRLVSKTYVSRGERVPALVDVHLDICSGETLGLVGESGSGKTTLAHVLMGLTPPDEGSAIELSGIPLAALASGRTREQLRALQIVFQNPDSALNRRHTVRQLISRSLARLGGLRGRAREVRLMELVAAVRMEPRQLSMRPAQLSGGLKQRVAIARAFAGTPSVVVCDEPTSALDVSVQAAILNLLADLQAKEQATYLFISHDLGVVRYLADRIAVLYLGRVVEIGPAEAVFSGPHHPYTEALLSAVPSIDGQLRDRIRLSGEIPSPADPPSGCVFHTRCPRRLSSGQCESVEPPLVEVEPGHSMACHILFDQLHRLQIIDRYDSV